MGSLARFVSMLYSHPEWPLMHPEVMKNELRDILQTNWVTKLLFSPTWLLKHLLILKRKKERGQPINFTDLYGYLVGDVFRRKVSLESANVITYLLNPPRL